MIFNLLFFELEYAQLSLLLRAQRPRLAFAQVIFLLAKTDMATECPLVRRRCGIQEKGFVPDFIAEYL